MMAPVKKHRTAINVLGEPDMLASPHATFFTARMKSAALLFPARSSGPYQLYKVALI